MNKIISKGLSCCFIFDRSRFATIKTKLKVKETKRNVDCVPTTVHGKKKRGK